MTKGTVRWYNAEEGWGVLDSEDTPGGCAVMFSNIEMEGFRFLTEGQRVTFQPERGPQDGYPYRAVRVVPA